MGEKNNLARKKNDSRDIRNIIGITATWDCMKPSLSSLIAINILADGREGGGIQDEAGPADCGWIATDIPHI